MLVRKRGTDLLREILGHEKEHVEDYIQGVMFLCIPGMILGMANRRSSWWLISTVVFFAGAALLEEIEHRNKKRTGGR